MTLRSLPLRRRIHAVAEADDIVGDDFFQRVLHSSFDRLEGALHRCRPRLTGRLRKRSHEHGLDAITEVEGVDGTPAAPSVHSKIADGAADGHRVPVPALRI